MPRVLLPVVFFVSGAAALLFQTLWFRQAGLAFGNSVWASSLVLASFMAGLGLGNALAARRRTVGPTALRLYSGLELLIAVTGLGLVLILPLLPAALAPLFRPLAEQPAFLNLLRFGLAFALLLVPTTAMGATLPILMSALAADRGTFGSLLGRLYGWNTLGAVAGALAGEVWLVERFGLQGSGAVAATLNLVAGAGAFVIATRMVQPSAPSDEGSLPARWPWRLRGVILAAALCGGAALALEVVWFRFLQLYVVGTSLAFAVMLAVVLLGIAVGGLVAGRWLHWRPEAYRLAPVVILGAGVAAVLGYVKFDDVLRLSGVEFTSYPRQVLALAVPLMFPTCLLSGIAFPLLGRALREDLPRPALAAGALTLANTAGAAIGALVGGFVLLPRLGVESSVFVLALVYGVASLLVLRPAGTRPVPTGVLALAGAVFVGIVALFPFGLMARTHEARLAQRYAPEGLRPVAGREGLTETLLYLRRDLLGEPYVYRLITNGYPMSGTTFAGQRYMKLYVHWALAANPGAKRALLVSYGVGSTAEALTGAAQLESIDVVDISRDILEMSRIVFPPPRRFPLEDPRVGMHVEDGRFFLLTTANRYDLVTSEPPPPRVAGVVSLYSQEYFELIRSRLNPGGLVTYWLPVFDLNPGSTRAIVRGFCNAFPDCSAWVGSGLNWMLVGTRDASGPVDEDAFSRQWLDPEVGPALTEIGFETPEDLGATFLADAPDLVELAGDAPPLRDDFPRRVALQAPSTEELAFYLSYMDAEACLRRFEQSRFIRETWPPRLRETTPPVFARQAVLNRSPIVNLQQAERAFFTDLYESLVATTSRVLPLVVAGSEPREVAIAARAEARGETGSLVDYTLGLGALAERRFAEAAERFGSVAVAEPDFEQARRFRGLALCLAGDTPPPVPSRGATAEDTESALWSSLAAACPEVAEAGLIP